MSILAFDSKSGGFVDGKGELIIPFKCGHAYPESWLLI